jgi:hypothetical protein
LLAKENEHAAAVQDLDAAHSLSVNTKKLIQQEVNSSEKDVTELRKQIDAKSTSTTALAMLSYAELDKKRAIAIAGKEAWVLRTQKKAAEVSSYADIAFEAILDAEASLELQKQHLLELQQTHTELWATCHADTAKSHDAKIAQLEALCQAKDQCKTFNVCIGQDSPMVTQLQEALADAQKLVLEQKELMAAANLRYLAMETRLAALAMSDVDKLAAITGTVLHEAPTTSATASLAMSPAGDGANTTYAAASEEAQSDGKGDAKGKGKGAHGNY